MDRAALTRIIIVVIVVLITALFFAMIRPFLMAIILAGIFSAMTQPLYRRFEQWLGGHRNLASLVTLVFIFIIIIVPLLGLLGIFAGQAIKIGQSVRPLMEQMKDSPWALSDSLRVLPFYDILTDYRETILQRAGELAGKASSFLINSVSTITVFTLHSVFLFFVFLYTMFFFLKDGRRILERFLFYLPLPTGVEQRLLERFTSVTRAAIKGVLVIGLLQGGLAGFAFWIVGIDSAVFWGTIMTILSIIPAVGPTLVWFPAVIILAFSESYLKAAFLFAFCSLLVGAVDTILRPWLVGRDTRMHELMIFFGTLGGLGMFGIAGFIMGPIIAALFITVWEIYAENFSGYLPGSPSGEEKAE